MFPASATGRFITEQTLPVDEVASAMFFAASQTASDLVETGKTRHDLPTPLTS